MPSSATKFMTCLLCHYEPDEGKHLPSAVDAASGVYVCRECEARAKTVSSFGLTVEELKTAAAEWKERRLAYIQSL